MKRTQKWKSRLVRLTVLIVIAVSILGIAGWQQRQSWRLLAVDGTGKPIEGLEIYVTYPSEANPPMFRTGANGVAIIKPRSKDGIASLSLYFQGKKLGIPWRDVQWPVRVVVSAGGIEVRK